MDYAEDRFKLPDTPTTKEIEFEAYLESDYALEDITEIVECENPDLYIDNDRINHVQRYKRNMQEIIDTERGRELLLDCFDDRKDDREFTS